MPCRPIGKGCQPVCPYGLSCRSSCPLREGGVRSTLDLPPPVALGSGLGSGITQHALARVQETEAAGNVCVPAHRVCISSIRSSNGRSLDAIRCARSPQGHPRHDGPQDYRGGAPARVGDHPPPSGPDVVAAQGTGQRVPNADVVIDDEDRAGNLCGIVNHEPTIWVGAPER